MTLSTLHRKRKQTGSFYTPPHLAKLLAQEVFCAFEKVHPQVVWSQLTVLDPAAGEGELLLAAADLLLSRRLEQETHATPAQIERDIFTRQLFAADINAAALAVYAKRANQRVGVCALNLYCTDALAAQNGQSMLANWHTPGFDMVIANPPYIGQKGHANLFRALRENPLWKPYATPKSHLSYYFFYLTLQLLKPQGVAGFITPPYFSTAQGAQLLRRTLRENVTFLRLINFGERHIFPGLGQHTLISVFSHGKTHLPCHVGIESYPQDHATLFYGPDLFLRTLPPGQEETLLARMNQAAHRLEEVATVSNGLMTGCDKAFILTDEQKKKLPLTTCEKAKLKPFFKNSDIVTYVPNQKARLWLIDFFYPNDRNTNIKNYPHLLAHLMQFKDKLLSRKQNNNGIDKQLALGRFWFGSVRRKMDFEAEKLVLPHRAAAVTAAYAPGPWYASSDVYFISAARAPYTLWTLLGLLNSAPYQTWLAANGKRKGKLLELYSAPLKQLPIPALTPLQQTQLEELTHTIYRLKAQGHAEDLSPLQNRLDTLVAALF
ncbi:MAG: N-6 DNA methylase [Elusimicrobiaceae bacterium]|nr:N-6 DNA methylase [Elusimicrobiaceae bacterium]